ncbi:hypothetical protein CGRA01v4_04666 [Colletotrichum graminicola]|nr:hypothetical protein CGRA01v4_04666 [Colletotrichum graminicola]
MPIKDPMVRGRNGSEEPSDNPPIHRGPLVTLVQCTV